MGFRQTRRYRVAAEDEEEAGFAAAPQSPGRCATPTPGSHHAQRRDNQLTHLPTVQRSDRRPGVARIPAHRRHHGQWANAEAESLTRHAVTAIAQRLHQYQPPAARHHSGRNRVVRRAALDPHAYDVQNEHRETTLTSTPVAPTLS